MVSKIHLVFVVSIVITILLTTLTTSYITTSQPSLTQTTPGTFYWPRDVAVNSTGSIFVADTQNSRIQVFNADGAFNNTFAFPGNNPNDASLNQPFGLFINSSGFVHVTDTFTNVIKIYDGDGNYLKTIGSGGTGFDEYYYPSGIYKNSTNIFIADTFNHRIVITDNSGNTVDTIP